MSFVDTVETEAVSTPDCLRRPAADPRAFGHAPLRLQGEYAGKESEIKKGARVAGGWILVFVYLQLLDLLTTLVGFKLGAQEGSPFVRLLLHAGAVEGVVMAKLAGLAIGAVCIRAGKVRIMKWIVYWSGALVVWNLVIILASA